MNVKLIKILDLRNIVTEHREGHSFRSWHHGILSKKQSDSCLNVGRKYKLWSYLVPLREA